LLDEGPPPPPPLPPRFAKHGGTSHRSTSTINSSSTGTGSTTMDAKSSSRSMATSGGSRNTYIAASSKSNGDASAVTTKISNGNGQLQLGKIRPLAPHKSSSRNNLQQQLQQQQEPSSLMVHTGHGDIEMTGVEGIIATNALSGSGAVNHTTNNKLGARVKLGRKVKKKMEEKRLESLGRETQAMIALNDTSTHHIHKPTVYFDDEESAENELAASAAERANANADAGTDGTEEDVEWTPQDSSYGAACPVCGCVPKEYRQYIELAIMAVATAAVVVMTVHVIAPLTFFHSSGHNSSSRNSTSTSVNLDDDFYVEYTSNGESNYNNQVVDDYYNAANDDGNYNNNNGEEGDDGGNAAENDQYYYANNAAEANNDDNANDDYYNNNADANNYYNKTDDANNYY
jgi:hypothetical protein